MAWFYGAAERMCLPVREKGERTCMVHASGEGAIDERTGASWLVEGSHDEGISKWGKYTYMHGFMQKDERTCMCLSSASYVHAKEGYKASVREVEARSRLGFCGFNFWPSEPLGLGL